MEDNGGIVLGLLSGQRLLCLIITIIFIILAFPVDIIAQSDTAWYWRRGDDADTVRRTRAELDSLIRLHAVWLQDSPKGERLSLRGAYLQRADLSRAHLIEADLSDVNLSGADLSGAFLVGANLDSSDLSSANLSAADLWRAHLIEADLSDANLSRATLPVADLSGAFLVGANLDSANLSRAILKRANLAGANLSRAILKRANLADATLCGADRRCADLSGADLSGADLSGAILNSVALLVPNFRGARLSIADFMVAILSGADVVDVQLEDTDALRSVTAKELTIDFRSLRFQDSPLGLVKMREEFGKLGYKDQERQIICALRRHNANILDRVFFDWTSEYGSNLTRPWSYICFIWLLCICIYCLFMLRESNSGIRLIQNVEKEDADPKLHTYVSLHQGTSAISPYYRKSAFLKQHQPIRFAILIMVMRLLWWAFFFSSISAFNIGFRDVRFSSWLKLLTRTKFDLQPFGWVRIVSGFQALTSVYLIALWILSFSGTPFK